ncbi:MAG: glutaredoxin family protein [Gammaproteobacteria bacterium]|nr:glutaredoxin family protein [Gammaproteobacteria bacterium]
MTKIKFYTTIGCHLCEDAHLLIDQLVKQGSVSVQMIDIADSDELIDSYGIRIPVIQRTDTEKELGWPFDESELAEFLVE